MSDKTILYIAIAVFVLMLIGLIQTIREFRQVIDRPPSNTGRAGDTDRGTET